MTVLKAESWPSIEPTEGQLLGTRGDCMWVAARYGAMWGLAFMKAGVLNYTAVPCHRWSEVEQWFGSHGQPPVDLDRLTHSGETALYETLIGKRVSAPKAAPQSCVYFIQAGVDGPIKIGKAINVQSRLATLQTSSPYRLRVLATEPGDEVRERELHRQFGDVRMHGEWFEPSSELMAYIGGLA